MYPALFDTEHFFQKLLRLNPSTPSWKRAIFNIWLLTMISISY